MGSESEDRRASHLMDPDAPRKVATAEERRRLEIVQRRVLTALIVTTIFHLSAGLVIAAVAIDDSRRDAQIGLCILGGAFGVLAVAAGLAINRRSLLSPWLLVALVPTLIGLYVVYR